MSLIKLPKVQEDVVIFFCDDWKIVKQDEHHCYLVPHNIPNNVNAVLRLDRFYADKLTRKTFSPVGTMLENERIKKGYSQRDLAEKAGVSQMTISNVEGGACDKINSETLDRIVEALGIPLNDVYSLCMKLKED